MFDCAKTSQLTGQLLDASRSICFCPTSWPVPSSDCGWLGANPWPWRRRGRRSRSVCRRVMWKAHIHQSCSFFYHHHPDKFLAGGQLIGCLPMEAGCTGTKQPSCPAHLVPLCTCPASQHCELAAHKHQALTCIVFHSACASAICVTSKKSLLLGMPSAFMPLAWRHSLK